jgi:uncharacterized protein YdeI (YjbR/CyaY-like superfamily)
MDITNTLYVANRDDWRQWLKENYQTADEIWLVSFRKHTGTPSIPYSHAVEEALCFGWIDSVRKSIDQERFAQRFTPRNPRSGYSQTNKERLKRLIEQGKVMPDVLASIGDVAPEEYEFPLDVMAVLQANTQAWENFQRYSGPYQRIRIAFIDSARKRPGEFEKRLKHFIQMTKQDKQFGYGIEEFY